MSAFGPPPLPLGWTEHVGNVQSTLEEGVLRVQTIIYDTQDRAASLTTTMLRVNNQPTFDPFPRFPLYPLLLLNRPRRRKKNPSSRSRFPARNGSG